MTYFRGENVKDADLVIGRDGSAPTKWGEIGTTGLNTFAGLIQEAYLTEYQWPQCWPTYKKLWRADPEVSIALKVFSAMSMEQTVRFDHDPRNEDPTPEDEEAVQFGNEVLDDVDVDRWFSKAMSTVPFFGWAWWEAVPAVRSQDWVAPDRGDPATRKYRKRWQSKYDDGLVGWRKLAFRGYDSFYEWGLDEETGELYGLWQHDLPNPPVLMPLDRSLHVTFGDPDNPEGLATFEALARLERIKYALELVMGMGFERSAGYVKFQAEDKLSEDDKAYIRTAARRIMTLQEGNYLSLPGGITADIIDSTFQAAGELINAIRYFGILKLALFGMQWAALGTLSPFGSYSSMQDASEFFLTIYNSISEGVVKQADEQLGARLFEYEVNKQAFANMTMRPVLTVTQAEKSVKLNELGAFLQAMSMAMPLGEDDWMAFRRKSGFLPEVIPAEPVMQEPEEEQEPEGEEAGAEESVTPEGTEQPEGETETEVEPETGEGELAFRPFVVSDDEQPTTVEQDAFVTEKDARRAIRKWVRFWERENDDVTDILNAEMFEEEE